MTPMRPLGILPLAAQRAWPSVIPCGSCVIRAVRAGSAAHGRCGRSTMFLREDSSMQKFECGMCEYTYDPAKGDPGRGIPPGTSFDDLPDNWTCPKCNAGKNMFVAVDE
mgnify:CR=1 FL=1